MLCCHCVRQAVDCSIGVVCCVLAEGQALVSRWLKKSNHLFVAWPDAVLICMEGDAYMYAVQNSPAVMPIHSVVSVVRFLQLHICMNRKRISATVRWPMRDLSPGLERPSSVGGAVEQGGGGSNGFMKHSFCCTWLCAADCCAVVSSQARVMVCVYAVFQVPFFLLRVIPMLLASVRALPPLVRANTLCCSLAACIFSEMVGRTLSAEGTPPPTQPLPPLVVGSALRAVRDVCCLLRLVAVRVVEGRDVGTGRPVVLSVTSGPSCTTRRPESTEHCIVCTMLSSMKAKGSYAAWRS